MFTVGRFYTNCYVVGCEETKEAVIVDPGFDDRSESRRVSGYIEENFLALKYAVNTHGHPDHTCGNLMVKEEFQVPILIHKYDAYKLKRSNSEMAGLFGFSSCSPPADKLLVEGDLLSFGKITLKVVHTPGHSRGSISLLAEKEVFTGDTLFAGSVGRMDFPESSELEMKSSLKKLSILPDHFSVYPGHGPMTTIGEEKRSNPFLSYL